MEARGQGPRGEIPGGGKARRGSTGGTRVTLDRRHGSSGCTNPWSQVAALRRRGPQARGAARGGSRGGYQTGETSEGEIPGADRHETRPIGRERNKTSRG